MNVKIIYDLDEQEYICFVPSINIQGYGANEADAVKDFLLRCEKDPRFNQKIIQDILRKI